MVFVGAFVRCKFNECFFTYISNSIYLLFLWLSWLVQLFYFFTLFNLNDVGLKIGLLFLSVELVRFLLIPLSYGFEPIIHLEYSAFVNTSFGVVKYIIRMFISVSISFAYCTQIEQLIAMFLSLEYLLYIRMHFYKLIKDGFLLKKIKK